MPDADNSTHDGLPVNPAADARNVVSILRSEAGRRIANLAHFLISGRIKLGRFTYLGLGETTPSPARHSEPAEE
jgi:hypothetical protein